MTSEGKTYDLFISDELTNILKEIESESIVAQLLLKYQHDRDDLVNDPVNFLSISREDRTKISYLTEDRMKVIDSGQYWTSSRRFQAKPGAFVSKLFKNISSREVEKFSNLFRSQSVKPKFMFKIVSGESIRRYYHFDSYQSDKGTLGASCMKHDSCQKYLDVYVYNTDKISLLIMTDDYGSLMGRALLWKFDSHKIMDRIYTICDEDLLFYFKKWSTENGYLYKSEQNWYNTLQFEQIGQKRQELKLELKIDTEFRCLPYMDTFKFLDTKTGILYNYQHQSRYLRTLCSSEGSSYEGDYLRFDGVDRVLRYQGDSAWVEYKGFFTHYNNISWSDVNGQYILNSDSIYCEELSDCIFNGEFDHLNNHDEIKRRKQEIKDYESRRTKKSTREDIINQLGLQSYEISEQEIDEVLSMFSRNRQNN